ncbi:hypothetical protein QTN25_001282 [Entamoeba marina]
MLLFVCVTLVLGEYSWTESITESITTIYKSDGESTRTGWSYNQLVNPTFTLNSNFISKKLVLSNLDCTSSSDDGNYYINFGSTPLNLVSVQMRFWNNDSAFQLNTNNLNELLKISIGCFGEETGCSTSTTRWNLIFTSTIGFTVFGSDVSQRIGVVFKEIITDPFAFPYIYIDGNVKQLFGFWMKSLSYNDILSYSKTYYLFTIPTAYTNIYYYYQNDTGSGFCNDFIAGSICVI